MKRLFNSPLDKLYSITTLIVIAMILFTPVYALYEDGSSFRGYEFVFDLRSSRLIDLGRLSLQFIGLGTLVVTIKRVIHKT